jgi:DNA-damage-inducible protein J
MTETRLSVRVDEDVKRRAENVFQELGLTMSTGIVLYLNQVVAQRGIPFPSRQAKPSEMEFRKQMEELKAQMAVDSKIEGMTERGAPIALYDDQQKRPYLQHPDGRRVYDIGK